MFKYKPDIFKLKDYSAIPAYHVNVEEAFYGKKYMVTAVLKVNFFTLTELEHETRYVTRQVEKWMLHVGIVGQ